MTTPAGVYPFATQDGKAIPLDIIKPSGLLYQTFTSGAETQLTIDEDAAVGVFITDAACLIRFGSPIGALVPDTLIEDIILVPADAVVTCALTPGVAYIKGLGASGTVYLQIIEKWAGLGLASQYNRK